MHPDFEFKLWTDESSIDFLKEHYNWFLPTFLEYKFDIQRADAIRYFVLHKYGGVYMDLDIGELHTISLPSTRRRCLLARHVLGNHCSQRQTVTGEKG